MEAAFLGARGSIAVGTGRAPAAQGRGPLLVVTGAVCALAAVVLVGIVMVIGGRSASDSIAATQLAASQTSITASPTTLVNTTAPVVPAPVGTTATMPPPASRLTPATTPSSRTTTRQPTYLNAAGEPVPPEELRALGGAPSDVLPFWTIVVKSAFHDAPEAFRVVNQAAVDASDRGLRAAMIDASGYASLDKRPVFAAVSGGFDSRERADAHRAQVRALGFSGAYRVCVGDSGQCPADHRGAS